MFLIKECVHCSGYPNIHNKASLVEVLLFIVKLIIYSVCFLVFIIFGVSVLEDLWNETEVLQRSTRRKLTEKADGFEWKERNTEKLQK